MRRRPNARAAVVAGLAAVVAMAATTGALQTAQASEADGTRNAIDSARRADRHAPTGSPR